MSVCHIVLFISLQVNSTNYKFIILNCGTITFSINFFEDRFLTKQKCKHHVLKIVTKSFGFNITGQKSSDWWSCERYNYILYLKLGNYPSH